MKQFIISCLAVACLLSACNNNSKTAEATSKDTTATAKTEVQIPEEMKKQADELQKLTPLSLDELKALLPEQVMGAKKSDVQAVSANGTGLASAEYDLNDSTEIKISIWDCAGAGGAGLYNSRFLGMFNIQSESDQGYTKTIDFKGQKAFEQCDKGSDNCTMTYFTGKRYMVVLEGRKVASDGLKQAANELNL
jgi:hypothetical protein